METAKKFVVEAKLLAIRAKLVQQGFMIKAEKEPEQ
jgi:hypothetical protein